MISLRVLVAAVLPCICAAAEPAVVYNGGYGDDSSILLGIGDEGAGHTGLIGALADAFIQDRVSKGSNPFRVAWYNRSDTTSTIDDLKDGVIDIVVAYNSLVSHVALLEGVAIRTVYAWRDHFVLVGPRSNPANLDITTNKDIYTLFIDFYKAAEAANSTPPVRFLSRCDKSATNIKESEIWITIGQIPWATANSTWYHQYIAPPMQALNESINQKEYTLTDLATLSSLAAELRDQTTIFKAGSDNATDPLLNPAHMLLGAKAPNPDVANTFLNWMVGAGQDVIIRFVKNGQVLYSPAPKE